MEDVKLFIKKINYFPFFSEWNEKCIKLLEWKYIYESFELF